MAEVVVKVNGRDFALSCADGQEGRIRRLAQYVDARVGEFVKGIGQAGEARLILLAALVIADELSDATDALAQERSRPRPESAEAAPDAAAPDAAAQQMAVAGIRDLADRIEAIAARLDTP